LSDGKGKGSRFVINLPTTTPPDAPQVRSGIKLPSPQQRRLRILLAEDHADTRTALERLLLRWGHEVRSAPTVSEAAAIALTYEADLLLSDIGLPDGSGIELLGKIRHDRDIKAIAMSGYGMEADLEMTRHAGFMEHLIKPVSAERLKEALSKVFDGQK
jgi:CheY-like chemotaxis protein